MAGRLLLTRYLKDTKTTHEAFAKRVGVSRAIVSFWCSRTDLVPSGRNVVAIEAATGGAVPASSWSRPIRRRSRRSSSNLTQHS